MNQLTVITDLPEWVLKLAQEILVYIAAFSGNGAFTSIRKAPGADDEQNSLDGTN